jgi:hypothetical protein
MLFSPVSKLFVILSALSTSSFKSKVVVEFYSLQATQEKIRPIVLAFEKHPAHQNWFDPGTQRKRQRF